MEGEHKSGNVPLTGSYKKALMVLHCHYTSALDPQECFSTTLGRPPSPSVISTCSAIPATNRENFSDQQLWEGAGNVRSKASSSEGHRLEDRPHHTFLGVMIRFVLPRPQP